MRTVQTFQARQKLSKLIERARAGEHIGITRRGKLVAVIGPPPYSISLAQAFANINEIRKRVNSLTGITLKELVDEGRQ